MLILDNCEHLVEAAAAFADVIIKTCPAVTLITTTREKLRVAGEQIFSVATLTVPTKPGSLSLAEFIDYAAVRLFVERAAMAAPGFALDADNAPAIGAVCRLLDGLPLAIELAASRIALLSPAEMLDRLRGRFDVLSGGSRTAMPRQHTLRATIAWSFDLLSVNEQRALVRLAVFEGSFALPTASEVIAVPPIEADEAFELIASLADKSMISRLASNAGGSRYRMLETTRQFCFERLLVLGETEATRQRLAVVMARVYDQATRDWASWKTADWRATYAMDFENLSAAIEWALRAETALGLELVSVAAEICHETSNGSSLRRWYELAEPLIGPETPKLVEARFRLGAATSRPFGEGANVRVMSRALELYRELGDVPHLAIGLSFMTWAPAYDGVENAEFRRACLEEVRPMLAALKSDKLRSIVLGNFAATLSPEEAIALNEEAEAIAERFEDKNGVLWCRSNRLKHYFALGDIETARRVTLKCVAESWDCGDKWLVGAFLCETIALGCLTGNLDEAREAVPGALESFRSFDNQIGVDWTIERAALLAACEGSPREAARLSGYCEAVFTSRQWARDALQTTVRERLATMLEGALTPEARAALMRQGAAWSREDAHDATLARLEQAGSARR